MPDGINPSFHEESAGTGKQYLNNKSKYCGLIQVKLMYYPQNSVYSPRLNNKVWITDKAYFSDNTDAFRIK